MNRLGLIVGAAAMLTAFTVRGLEVPAVAVAGAFVAFAALVAGLARFVETELR